MHPLFGGTCTSLSLHQWLIQQFSSSFNWGGGGHIIISFNWGGGGGGGGHIIIWKSLENVMLLEVETLVVLVLKKISRGKQNKISRLCRILNACAYFLWLCIILMEAANQVATYIIRITTRWQSLLIFDHSSQSDRLIYSGKPSLA